MMTIPDFISIEIFFTPSMIMGPVRLILFFAFIVFLKNLGGREKSVYNGLDYFVPGYAFYLSAFVLGSYLLIQVNAFDEFVLLLAVFGFILFALLNLKWDKTLLSQLAQKRNYLLLFAVRNFEKYKTFRSIFQTPPKIKKTKSSKFLAKRRDIRIQYGILIFVAAMAYGSRYYFYAFDTYMLSDLWYDDLRYLKELDAQKWLFTNGSMMGEFAVISLYALISDTSDAIALQSFGLLESAVLAGMLFWTTSRLTGSRYVPGLVAALSFTFLYGFIPLDVSLLTQHKSVFLALTLVLPLLVFVLKPGTLSDNSRFYFLKLLVIFSAIAFIDLFVMIVILPVFLLFASVLAQKKDLSDILKVALAYFIGLFIVLFIHFIAAVLLGYSIEAFILSNLYSVSSYTYAPQLAAPLPILMQIYLGCAIAMSFIILPLWINNKKHWYPAMTLVLFSAALLFMSTWEEMPIDKDLLYQVISVIAPVFLGISIYILNAWIGKIIKIKTSVPLELAVWVSTMGIVSLLFQNNILTEIPQRNIVNEEIIEAYDILGEKNLPFSYSVVNSSANEVISVNDHFFINYDYFNDEYIQRDSIYAANRLDVEFLKKHPEIILSNSTFVFLYNENAIADDKNKLNAEEQQKTRINLARLMKAERSVQLFLKKTSFSVYEIINEPNATNIQDLIFYNHHLAQNTSGSTSKNLK
jgi:hypothetical protein